METTQWEKSLSFSNIRYYNSFDVYSEEFSNLSISFRNPLYCQEGSVQVK